MHPKGDYISTLTGSLNKEANSAPEKEFEDETDPDDFRNFEINPKTGEPDPDRPKTGVEEEPEDEKK